MAGTWKAPPGWTRLRLQVFARYGRVCWRCGAYATTVDHVVARVLGGTHDLDNLRPCCSRCNYSTGAALGNRMRPRRQLSAQQRRAIALKRATGTTGSSQAWPSSRQW